MTEKRNCPSCGSASNSEEVRSDLPAEDLTLDELRPFWSGLFKKQTFFSYARCQDCGLLFAPYFFSADQLSELYANMLANMPDVSQVSREATQHDYWRIIDRAVGSRGGYLELGPDAGWIVRHAAAADRFDKFWLVEPNRAMHAHLDEACGDRPRLISTEMNDLSPVPDGSVSVAVLVHVLDHLLDPVASLQQIRRKLRPDGVLFVVTHNERSLLRKVMGKRFPPFCLQHPELYNPNTITEMLQRTGFGQTRVERTRSHFPVAFMLRQAAWTIGVDLVRLPLPEVSIGLRLGNIAAVARAA